jgi:hypothetical protein
LRRRQTTRARGISGSTARRGLMLGDRDSGRRPSRTLTFRRDHGHDAYAKVLSLSSGARERRHIRCFIPSLAAAPLAMKAAASLARASMWSSRAARRWSSCEQGCGVLQRGWWGGADWAPGRRGDRGQGARCPHSERHPPRHAGCPGRRPLRAESARRRWQAGGRASVARRRAGFGQTPAGVVRVSRGPGRTHLPPRPARSDRRHLDSRITTPYCRGVATTT